MTRFPWFLLTGASVIFVALIALPPVESIPDDASLTISDPAGLRVFLLGAGGTAVVLEVGLWVYRLFLALFVRRVRGALGQGAAAIVTISHGDSGSNWISTDSSSSNAQPSGRGETFVLGVSDSVLEIWRSTGLAHRVDSKVVLSIQAVHAAGTRRPALRVTIRGDGHDDAARDLFLEFFHVDLSRGVRPTSDLEHLEQTAAELMATLNGDLHRELKREAEEDNQA